MAGQSQVWNRGGIGNVGSYQVSGIPYITGSTLLSSSFATNNAEQKIVFPYVTKAITVISRASTNLRVHFNSVSASGNVITGKHYITLSDTKDSITLGVKCKEIYISLEDGTADGEFELVAELTSIPFHEMYELTGSGFTD